MAKAVYDFDFILYNAAASCESRTVEAFHKPTKKKLIFSARTDLWGDWRNKNGGWIAEQNEELGKDFYHADDFVVEDIQEPRPITIGRKVIDNQINKSNKKLAVSSYYGYSGKGESFRLELSSIMKYKGQRENMIRPLNIDNLRDYLIDKHHCKLVSGIEADDAFAMDLYAAHKKWLESKTDANKLIGVAIDKDAKQIEGFHYNPDKDNEVRYINGLGKLWLTGDGDVDGYGRKWLYFQILSKDAADNYCANSATDKRWGVKAAYKLLLPCTTDKECIQALVNGYRVLYPEPFEFVGWRGDTLKLDWMKVLQENWNMAHMLRFEGDRVDVAALVQKLGINCD